MSQDCYIYWDEGNIPDRCVYIQCTKCFKENGLGKIWRKEAGYQNTIICKCGEIIHEEKIEKPVKRKQNK